jgi:hypothetical protein
MVMMRTKTLSSHYICGSGAAAHYYAFYGSGTSGHNAIGFWGQYAYNNGTGKISTMLANKPQAGQTLWLTDNICGYTG